MGTAQMIISLLGGLALFLYGMQMMSDNLEAVAGSRMKGILEKLTANRFLGVLVGAGITAVIQSSSATTVMVVGFVNSGLMTLRQAVWIIMGANIGTTVTGLLVALDIQAIAPLIAFAGVVLILFSKRKKVQFIGCIIAGLGILFIGMGMMSEAMAPLRDSEAFVNIITRFSNPLIGILVGAGFTAIIQSSSASVGILQALARSGVIALPHAVYVLFGQNIGTCITAVLAAIGANRNAKRTTVIHLMFNVIGTVIFVIICMVTPFTEIVAGWTPDNPAAQIANVHVIFNVTTTILLLPFGTKLALLAEKILPDRKEGVAEDEDTWLDEMISHQHMLGSVSVAVNSLLEEIKQMLALAFENVDGGFQFAESPKEGTLKEVEEREDQIDLYNVKISRRLSRIMAAEQSVTDTGSFNRIFEMAGNIERIGDHAMNLWDCGKRLKEGGLSFSEESKEEIRQMRQVCREAFEKFSFTGNSLKEMEKLEQKVDDMTERFRKSHLNRINGRKCDMESAILYSELLTDFERIGDHFLNLAQSCAGLEENHSF